MEMRERIARAIADYKESDDGPPFADALRDTFNLVTGKRDGEVKARQLCAALAGAVLAAMREPDEAMIEAGFRAPERGMNLGQSAAATYTAMIDAAMSPSPPSD